MKLIIGKPQNTRTGNNLYDVITIWWSFNEVHQKSHRTENTRTGNNFDDNGALEIERI